MTTRYCNRCKVHINFVEDNTKCPICCQETALETVQIRVKHVRNIFVRMLTQGDERLSK